MVKYVTTTSGVQVKLIRSEYYEQAAVCRWMHLRQMSYMHVPNELVSSHSKRESIKQKRLGFATGAPDLLIFDPPPIGRARGVAIEMKSAKGRVSKEQTEWLNKLSSLGWETKVAYGYADAISFLQGLGF